jgi:hypothetical protein
MIRTPEGKFGCGGGLHCTTIKIYLRGAQKFAVRGFGLTAASGI